MSQSAASPLAPTIWGRHTLAWGSAPTSWASSTSRPTRSRAMASPRGRATVNAFVAAAVEQAQRMVADGAEMLDIGGESTRPTTEDEPRCPQKSSASASFR